jgi:hypothetical protein
MRGKVLRQDDRIRCFIASANRDPFSFVTISTRALELGERRHGEKTSRVGRPQRVRWQCHV